MLKVLKSYLKPEPAQEEKLLAIRSAWIGFFEEVDERTGLIDIPAHERAEQILEELKANNEIDSEYNRVKRTRFAA